MFNSLNSLEMSATSATATPATVQTKEDQGTLFRLLLEEGRTNNPVDGPRKRGTLDGPRKRLDVTPSSASKPDPPTPVSQKPLQGGVAKLSPTVRDGSPYKHSPLPTYSWTTVVQTLSLKPKALFVPPQKK